MVKGISNDQVEISEPIPSLLPIKKEEEDSSSNVKASVDGVNRALDGADLREITVQSRQVSRSGDSSILSSQQKVSDDLRSAKANIALIRGSTSTPQVDAVTMLGAKMASLSLAPKGHRDPVISDCVTHGVSGLTMCAARGVTLPLELFGFGVVVTARGTCGATEVGRTGCEMIKDGAKSSYDWVKSHTHQGLKDWVKEVAQDYKEGAERVADDLYTLEGIPRKMTLQASHDLVTLGTLGLIPPGIGLAKTVFSGVVTVGKATVRGLDALQPAATAARYYRPLAGLGEATSFKAPSGISNAPFGSLPIKSTATPSEVSAFFKERAHPKFRDRLEVLSKLDEGRSVIGGSNFLWTIYTSEGQIGKDLIMHEIMPLLKPRQLQYPGLITIEAIPSESGLTSIFITRIRGGTPITEMIENAVKQPDQILKTSLALRATRETFLEMHRISQSAVPATVPYSSLRQLSEKVLDRVTKLGSESPYSFLEAQEITVEFLSEAVMHPIKSGYTFGRKGFEDLFFQGQGNPIAISNLSSLAASVGETGLPMGFIELDLKIAENTIRKLSAANPEVQSELIKTWRLGNKLSPRSEINKFVDLVTDLEVY